MPLLGRVSARYALSRLVGVLLDANGNYSDGPDGYNATPENKFLIDYASQKVEEHGALSVVIHTDRLAEEPFQGQPAGLRGGGQWYVNQEAGLFVSATSPATATAALMDSLTMSAGSEANALTILAAGDSVNLRPYVNHDHIRRSGQ